MYKQLILLFALILGISSFSQAQDRYKLNLALHLELEKNGQSEEILPIFVKGNLAGIRTATRQAGGLYKYGLGDIASIEIPANKIKEFANRPNIQRLEFNPERGVVLENDFVGLLNNLDSLHQGLGNLPSGIQGEGVLLGTIDTGLEWKHPDFINDDGSTRIAYMWDQVDTTCINNMPASFPYGCEWNSTDIDADIITHNPEVSSAHGTRVMGLAAGNGRAASAYLGGAPKADLIHVNIDFSSPFYAHFVDAVYYIFEKADELGKPCVINSSVGSYRGSHDASNLSTKLIENMLDAKPGRVLVQAAGNGGAEPIHVSYPVSADTLFTWFQYYQNVPGVGFDLYADTTDFNQVQFAWGTLDRNTYAHYGRTRFYNILEDMDLSLVNPVDSIIDSLVYNGESRGLLRIYGELIDDFYYLFFKISPVYGSDNWELQTTGSGRFHIWSHRDLIGTSRILDGNRVPSPATLPAIVNYRYPDSEYSLVSGWNCSEKVISVANYNNATYLTTYEGDTLYNTNQNGSVFYEQGAWVVASSIGPTRVGLQKPDIAATGNHTFAATTLARLDYQRVNEPNRVAPEGWHVLMGGTSASAPVVAGAVACYLELYPEASYADVKAHLENTAQVDSFVTNGFSPVPSYHWGYGKLDAFNFVSQQVVYGCTNVNGENYDPTATVDDGSCIIFGCTDSTATNYDPMANMDDGSCFVAGCTDSTATNYNPLATVDDGSCLFPSPTIDLGEKKSFLRANPNPFNEKVVIDYSIQEIGNTKLLIVDILGKELQSRTLKNREGSITFLRKGLNPGVYFLSLSVDDQIILTEKIVVQ